MEKELNRISNLIYEYIRKTYRTDIPTSNRRYSIAKNQQETELLDCEWDNRPSHPELFSPQGADLGLTVDLRIHVYIDNEKNLSHYKVFQFKFKNVNCKYNYDENKYELTNVVLDYIIESKGKYPFG